MQSFFDSVVSLIIKTSTDLPPDVRAAMKHAVETEDAASRAGQALNILSQNIDQPADIEGANLPGHRHADLRDQVPGGSDDEHSRGAVSGRHHRQIRGARGDRQRRMGARTLAGLKQHGAVYLNAIGGAAPFYARCIDKVDGVSLLEFGTPEALWHLQLKEFPAIVTMDAHGNSLHKDLESRNQARIWPGWQSRFRGSPGVSPGGRRRMVRY